MKLNNLFSAIVSLLLLTFGLTACDSEKDLIIIEGELPIKTEHLYMLGDATPNGWDNGNPTAFEASEDDPLTFVWEGDLRMGEIKLCLVPGSWDVPFIRPEQNGREISKTAITDEKFQMHAGDPDEKWRVVDPGTYRLSFDLRHWTMSTTFLAEPPAPSKDPIDTETLYMVGDATPNGWNIDDPYALDKASQYVFTYEGALLPGEMKLCASAGSWDVPFVRPTYGDCKITTEGVESPDFVYTTGPDDKWRVEEAGIYRLTFDLEHYTVAAEYLGEIPAQEQEPIVAETVYIVGDATPNGWSIDEPTALTKKSDYVFVYEGELVPGDMKACIATGSWDVPFIRPTAANCKISKEGVESPDFVYTTGPDDKWHVEEAGNYRITFDLENWTITVETL